MWGDRGGRGGFLLGVVFPKVDLVLSLVVGGLHIVHLVNFISFYNDCLFKFLLSSIIPQKKNILTNVCIYSYVNDIPKFI